MAPEEKRRERKVVTCLFCDLVGFTARAEVMDPEDVASLLAPYQARLKAELERYGGTVEKFIGDAVMALFGAPTAHEDDPERAVRAALAIRDFAEEEGIELRIGITTGEALVTLDARPDAGETLATGDGVNTAARLQAAAPVNGILVSEKTYEATNQAIEYAEAEPVEAKGKARPVPVWEAVGASPPQERAHTTPLVGRERELELLRAALARAREERAPQLVTLVGAPGIGKSRLVHELTRGDGGFAWRRGHCPPYGDGVTFWALGEVVKAHAGILESDSPKKAEQKLLACVEDSWIAAHLRLLVGAREGSEALGDRRAESFAAWSRFIAMIAEQQPVAIVLEDLHWSDDALLDFVTYVFEWVRDAPLLLLCTARPELLERRPGWGANDPRALTIALPVLSSDETEQLLSGLVQGGASEELVARTAGNPLYAEQYARLIAEGGSVEDLPTTVQGIVAERLDGLEQDEKSLLQDAAMIGGTFWVGAIAAVAESDRWSVEERLLALERRDLIRREPRSSVEGETEYAFAHILLRDVAYGQLPRAERADKHRLAAEWIESLGRPEDHAELLAHHYLSAFEFAHAAGQPTENLSERAREALRDAGDRALSLSAFDAAARFYAPALELCPHDDPSRARLLFGHGKALALGRGTGEEILAAARDAFVAAGDAETAAEAELLLADVWRLRAEGDRSRAHLDAAVALVRERPVSASKARVFAESSRFRMLWLELEEAIHTGREALAMAEALGLDELRAAALDTIGISRMREGDMRGREDLERSIEIATEANSVESVRAFINLGAGLIALGDLREAAAVWDRGREVGRRFGETKEVRYLELNVIDQSYWSGSWSDALQRSEDLIAESEAGSPHVIVVWAYDVRGRVRLARGDLDGALADARQGLEVARRSKEPYAVVPLLAFGAFAAHAAGRDEEATGLAEELLALNPARGPQSRFTVIFDLSIVLCELGRADALLAETARAEVETPWVDAGGAYARGDLERAAEVYAQTGALPFEAFTRLRAAERLIAEGRRAEADAQLQVALAFYRSVAATRYIREAEALLAATA